MTNSEKARELCKLYQTNRASLFQHLLAMAEWKDEQFEAEKQQLIKKACEWLKDNGRNYHSAYATEDRLIADFKKAMKGGEE